MPFYAVHCAVPRQESFVSNFHRWWQENVSP